MGKRTSILLVILLLFQLVAGDVFTLLKLNAEGKHEFFTDITVQENEEDGDESESETVNVQFDWSLEGLEVATTDSISHDVSEFGEVEEQQEGELTVEADDESDEPIVIGGYKATTDNIVTVTLEDEAIEYPEANGEFVVEVTVREDKEPEETEFQEEGSEETNEANKDNDESNQVADDLNDKNINKSNNNIFYNVQTH